MRFRYSTDAAYLDTGWFVDDVMVNGAAATLSSPEGEWFETDGLQDNNWTLQVVATCDLTPGVDSAFEIVDARGQPRVPPRGRRDLAGRLRDQVRERQQPRLRHARLQPADRRHNDAGCRVRPFRDEHGNGKKG